MTFRLLGALDLAAMQRSLKALLERHEGLRASFPVVNGQPVQAIRSDRDIPVAFTDLSMLSEEPRIREASRRITEEADRPFDLATGPLVRITVFRLGAEEHILTLVLHHIVTDAWSRGVLIHDLMTLYEAFRAQKPNPLAALPIQYADFAAWQRSSLAGETLQSHLAYWRVQLRDAPDLLPLPTDRPRPAAPSYRGARQQALLSSSLYEGLERLCKRSNTTLFMTLLAAFQVLLYRYSGQDDIVVGTPIANRMRPELEGLVGFFTNTLALRADLSGDPSFVAFLERVREVALGAYAHQDLPFEKLVEELQPAESSYSPIFQVVFMLQTRDAAAAPSHGLEIEPIDAEHLSAKFDLVLSLMKTPQGFETSLEYNTDLFDRERMERLLGHYRTLLEGIVADPDQKISRLPLLTAEERQRMLFAWNATAGACPQGRCVHHLFEEQVERTPDAIAVEYAGRRLTYAQLNADANRLAHQLREHGVGLEARVGLCAERSPEMMVGMLGILKSGAAYVPIDLSYPPQRIAFTCRDAEVALVLTHGDVHAALAEVEAPRLPLEADRQQFSAENLAGGDPLCPAYVIYTSGSTGQPKGVMMIHSALVNLLAWHRLVLPGSVRTLQFASIGFDVSVQETLVTWSNGGTVVLVHEDIRRDAPALLQLLDTERIERFFTPVAVLQHLALADSAVRPAALREIAASGEQLQLTPEIVSLLERLPGVTLHNHYGPSEAFAVTSLTFTGVPQQWPVLPPIGLAVLNVQVYLLDSGFQPVPVGVPGELYVGGAGLGRGYLKRPDLTAEKFVPDPFSGEPGARLYRTRDIARYLPDGKVEYLGRADGQTKIRGNRIELGEVESVLSQNTAVKKAVVVVREDAPGDRRLVAYVVGDEPIGIAALRAQLAEKLPSYMVPSAFVQLDVLPLNANGKVDRKRLPTPDRAVSEQEAEYAPPRNTTEEMLVEIWSQVLRVERVGIHDSFFDLGGHSLLATQVVSRIRRVFQVELPLRTLFENPTIAALGWKLMAYAPGAQEVGSIAQVTRDRRLPLSFAQERLWFMDQLQPDSSLLNFPMALRLTGKLDVPALERALDSVQQRHEALRTVFAEHQGTPIQIVQDVSATPITVTEVGPVPEDRQAEIVGRLIREEAKAPFDLARGPVFRCRLFRLHPEEHVLVLTLHHITADENSAKTLIHELNAFYRAELRGETAALPELPIQYADYALWQRERFDLGLFQSQVDYWKQQLKKVPAFLEVPTDCPRPAAPTFSRQSHRFGLSREALQNVMRLCREETVTPFMFFLAAFQILLSRHTGRKDILVGTDVLNRDRPETQNLIGFFINQLVLRTDLSDIPDFRHLLRRVRSVALEGYANQELPFNKLVELLQPARDPERPPFYQVKLAYTKGTASSPELEGLTASWIPADKGVAQLDLTLFLAERPEGIYGRMEYRDELYKPATIARFVREYESMIHVYSADPDLPLDAPVVAVVEPTAKTDARERLNANRAKLLGKKNP